MTSAEPSGVPTPQTSRAAHRVITPPNPTLPQPEGHIETRNVQVAVAGLDEEISLIDNDVPEPHDMRVVSAYYGAENFKDSPKFQAADLPRYHKMIAEQLRCLRWRFRIQEPFWFAFEALVNKDFLQVKLIESPITWTNIPEDIDGICRILESLEIVQQCVDMDPESSLEGFFDAPVLWFALLIRICCTDIQLTLEYLITARIFGGLDESHIRKIPKVVKYYSGDTNPKVSSEHPRVNPAFAFWLPQDLDDLDRFGRRWYQRYSRTVRIYENCFGVGSWGDWSDVDFSIGQLGLGSGRDD